MADLIDFVLLLCKIYIYNFVFEKGLIANFQPMQVYYNMWLEFIQRKKIKTINIIVSSIYTQRQWKVASTKISIFWKIYNTARRLPLQSCFWLTADWFGEKYQFHEPWNYGARDARAVCVFRSS